MSEEIWVPSAVDSKVASEGKTFSIDDDAGIHYGEFTLKYLPTYDEKLELEKKRAWARHGVNNNKEKDFYKRMAATLAHLSLTDWTLPTNPAKKNAKSPEFSADAAYRYLTQENTRHVLVELAQLAGNNANFQGENGNDSDEEVAGN